MELCTKKKTNKTNKKHRNSDSLIPSLLHLIKLQRNKGIKLGSHKKGLISYLSIYNTQIFFNFFEDYNTQLFSSNQITIIDFLCKKKL